MSANIYNSSNIDTLGRPFPQETATGLPYNFSSTPILGNPDGTIDYNSAVWTAFKTAVTASIPIGSGNGFRSEVTDDFLAKRVQEFFYLFQPFVTQEVYNAKQNSIEDTNVTYSNAEYYQKLFGEHLTNWMTYRRSNNANTDSAAGDFREYLKTKTQMQQRQRTVIMWQFLRVRDMIMRLQDRTLYAADRGVIWSQSASQALSEMNSIKIPAVSPSSEDARVPDPDSVAEQHAKMMDIERARAKFKRVDEKSNNEDATFSYSSDSVAQQRTTLNSFWSSLSNIMNNLLN